MQIIAVIQQKEINKQLYIHKNILHFVSSVFFGIIYNAVRTSVCSNSNRHWILRLGHECAANKTPEDYINTLTAKVDTTVHCRLFTLHQNEHWCPLSYVLTLCSRCYHASTAS